ncbi:hypothetical protein COY26_00605 [Candidatus Woesearchaeota archaeon CG_4_10_14_0_2_um_filter_33_10]|nr:MAG: hypothetical protein COY26_00605 [Candidatus Woesearchaeota archaeon CG_4_10_14_0_2_um_filter_33_10]
MRLIILSFIIFLLTFATSSSIGVSPARIDFGVLSKENPVEREFSLFNTQDIETSYLIYTTDYEDWFEFIPNKVSILSGKSTNIKMIVNIPQNINSETYHANIYIKQIDSKTNQISLSPAVAIKATLFVADNKDELSNSNINFSSKEIKFNITQEIQNKTNKNKELGNSSLFKINSNVVKQTNLKNNFAEIDIKGLIVTASIFFAGILLYSFKKTEPFEL